MNTKRIDFLRSLQALLIRYELELKIDENGEYIFTDCDNISIKVEEVYSEFRK